MSGLEGMDLTDLSDDQQACGRLGEQLAETPWRRDRMVQAAAYGSINRVRAKGEEARSALACVLHAIEMDVSLEALEKALATIKGHLEASA